MLSARIESIDSIRSRFQERRSVRVECFLDEAVAHSLRVALEHEELTIKARPSWSLGYQYFEYSFEPEADCEHELCRFGRWWRSDGVAWVESVVEQSLVPSPDGHVVSTLYTKGCYLDAHNDYDGRRAIALIIGLTREAWPAEDGGHLEFLEVRDNRVEVVERRAPGWATLDLFDVGHLDRPVLHRIPLLSKPHERRVISGWFYTPE